MQSKVGNCCWSHGRVGTRCRVKWETVAGLMVEWESSGWSSLPVEFTVGGTRSSQHTALRKHSTTQNTTQHITHWRWGNTTHFLLLFFRFSYGTNFPRPKTKLPLSDMKHNILLHGSQWLRYHWNKAPENQPLPKRRNYRTEQSEVSRHNKQFKMCWRER